MAEPLVSRLLNLLEDVDANDTPIDNSNPASAAPSIETEMSQIVKDGDIPVNDVVDALQAKYPGNEFRVVNFGRDPESNDIQIFFDQDLPDDSAATIADALGLDASAVSINGNVAVGEDPRIEVVEDNSSNVYEALVNEEALADIAKKYGQSVAKQIVAARKKKRRGQKIQVKGGRVILVKMSSKEIADRHKAGMKMGHKRKGHHEKAAAKRSRAKKLVLDAREKL